ncbi:endonuclease/exonuclease/phosphatase family protein [Luteolibacter sp. SL250]|uniref:endonuclease/exonuclease/phosphatase family protein n=1 Tax=Luteolibacter sp. SL250 TaxID=2995170 RepID=UPI0022718ECA|nr:endonuclease/exonuclease/phosphatase family protein [Luteolibacter sp. SL250]WAC20004.1 endonuclease/exonuclease/phosphatase family protein [Luteolibacter sp. SL250]
MVLRKVAAALLLMACPAVAQEKPPATLKVLCWNIHHGVGVDKKLDLERIAAVIRAQDPDVVALQEVDRGCRRSANTDQPTILGELTGLKSAFGEAMPYDGGSYGQAILSKHPIKSTEVIRLSQNQEPRIGFRAQILHPAGPVTLVSVHFDYRSLESRLAEGGNLLKALEPISGPLVVAGDLNDVPGSATLALFKAPWEKVLLKAPSSSFPAREPVKEIDHIFQRGLITTEEASVIDERIASDHRPITAVLKFRAE